MKTLVTGSTGLIGSNLIPILSKRNHKIKVIVRKRSKALHLKKYGVEIIEGDICDKKSIATAMQDCGYLFHLAADYRLWVPNPAEMYRVNVEGTRMLMQKALELGLKKIVYTSSVCTLGCSDDYSQIDENFPSSIKEMISPYKKSKFMAESVVKKMITEQNLPAVIVNPSTPVGPGDSRPTPTGAMILDTARKGGRFYARTGLNIAHVEDIAMGHLLALEKGQPGKRYILGGDNLTLKELFLLTSRIAGKPEPLIKIPSAILYPIAFISEILARIGFIKEPAATLDSIRMAQKTMFYNCKMAEEELGYKHRPAAEAVLDSINWFRANGML